MAREYTRVKLTIWNDPDFRQLTADAQWLYFVLMTHPSISLCGVVDWREARLTAISQDMNISRLRIAAVELGRGNFIAVDPDTEEALVRSFVRHDGVLQSPNMARAMVRQHAEIASQKIMALVSLEVRRATVDHPEWKGLEAAKAVWKQFPELESNPFEMVPETLAETLPERVTETLPQTLSGTLPKQFDFSSPIPEPITLTSKEVSSLAQPPVEPHPRTPFDAFWEHYPRKVGKGKAKPLFDRLSKQHDPQVIIDGAKRLAEDPNLPEAKYIPHPTTWLTRQGWEDEPLPDEKESKEVGFLSQPHSPAAGWIDLARQFHEKGI